MAHKYLQGRFKPKAPHKYIGDVTNIIYRSSLELQFFMYCDNHKDIVKWGSEEIIIPYISPIDGRYHRYFTDLVIKKSNGEVILIEIKPYSQTLQPVMKEGKSKRTFINEVRTWGINSSKWNAARQYCEKRGWKFMIITEKDLRKT